MVQSRLSAVTDGNGWNDAHVPAKASFPMSEHLPGSSINTTSHSCGAACETQRQPSAESWGTKTTRERTQVQVRACCIAVRACFSLASMPCRNDVGVATYDLLSDGNGKLAFSLRRLAQSRMTEERPVPMLATDTGQCPAVQECSRRRQGAPYGHSRRLQEDTEHPGAHGPSRRCL